MSIGRLNRFDVLFTEKDSIQLEYGQKIQLLALYKQEKLGPHTAEKDGETGYFDVVGADRRYLCVHCKLINWRGGDRIVNSQFECYL